MRLTIALFCFLATVCYAFVDHSIAASSETSDELLAQARDKLERYENIILHSWLARYSLGFNATLEHDETLYLFKSLRLASRHLRSDAVERRIAENVATRNFTSERPYPPALTYLLADQVASSDVLSFYHASLLADVDSVHLYDTTTASLLDTALLNAISNRVLLGMDVAWAKFIAQPAQFCQAIHAQDVAQIRTMLTNQKQVTTVLDRVTNKISNWTNPAFSYSVQYPQHTTQTILSLFNQYLIPITTQLEVQTIFTFVAKC